MHAGPPSACHGFRAAVWPAAAKAWALGLWPLAGLAAERSISSFHSLQCPARECLPQEASREDGRQLCYSSTGIGEAFAQCQSKERPHCAMCMTTPPCETWCEKDLYKPLDLGAPCHFDRECGQDASKTCYWGVCRRALWAGQKCDAEDRHTICLFGAQKCVDGLCQGLQTNQPCWDGYPEGRDLDCQFGSYCLRGVCVPQLPRGHTCFNEHPNECLRGHHCNRRGDHSQCDPEYSLPNGELANDARVCQSSHIEPRIGECAASPSFDSSGGECLSSAECMRSDGTYGDCVCKQWWDGMGAPGYCELAVPDMERPSLMAFKEKSTRLCHHDWPEERCAIEMGERDLHFQMLVERQATADPTLPVPACAQDLLVTLKHESNAFSQCRFSFSLILSVALWLQMLG